MKLGQNHRGNLTLAVPRTGRTWLRLAGGVGERADERERWSRSHGWEAARSNAAWLVGEAISLLLWRLLPSASMEFDTREGVVLKNGVPVARFADIDCVLISRPPAGEDRPHIVELSLAGRAPLFLGYTDDGLEASGSAARIARAVDRPVRVAA